MDLSKEQIKKILDEAPEGATHFDSYEYHGCYLWDSAFAYYCNDSSSWLDSHALNVNSEYLKKEQVFNLSDLRKQLDGEAEWENGDECVYLNSSEVHKFIGIDPTRSDFCYIKANCAAVNWVEIAKLSKPETEAKKVKRERLESAYDLYMEGQHSVDVIGYDNFEQFKSYKVQVKFWLAIVDKTKYRKGE